MVSCNRKYIAASTGVRRSRKVRGGGGQLGERLVLGLEQVVDGARAVQPGAR